MFTYQQAKVINRSQEGNSYFTSRWRIKTFLWEWVELTILSKQIKIQSLGKFLSKQIKIQSLGKFLFWEL